LTVTENKTPAAPPAGFKAIDPSSYKIALSKGADGLTLQKVDYVFDIAGESSNWFHLMSREQKHNADGF